VGSTDRSIAREGRARGLLSRKEDLEFMSRAAIAAPSAASGRIFLFAIPPRREAIKNANVRFQESRSSVAPFLDWSAVLLIGLRKLISCFITELRGA